MWWKKSGKIRTVDEFLAKNWQIGDRFYGAWHWFEITAIHKKSWGKIPMVVNWIEGNSRPDIRCVGVEEIDKARSVHISLDYGAEPSSYSILRVFRGDIEIWRDQSRLDRWPESCAIQDDKSLSKNL